MGKNRHYQTMPPKALQVCMVVANSFEVTIDQLLSRDRTTKIKIARFVSIHLLYNIGRSNKVEKISRRTLGDWFDNRDHTTIINVLQKVNDWLDIDENFRMHYNTIFRDTQHIEFGKPVKLTLAERIQRLPEIHKQEIINYITKIETQL